MNTNQIAYCRELPRGPGRRWMYARLLLSLCMLGAATVSLTGATPARRPNFVFILLDNIGQEWFGSYGSEENCTPNFDRLAKAGVRFENCYTPIVCGPSRVQLLTGRYPFHTGWYLHHDAALYGGGGFDWKREITIARVLRDAGYATGMAGKWQVNHLYDEPDAIRQHGFQESLVVPMSIDRDKVDAAFMTRYRQAIAENDADYLLEAQRQIENRYWDPVLMREGRREVLRGRFGPDVFQEYAIEFIKKHRDHPFFFYHSMVLAHGTSGAHPTTPTPDNRNNFPTDRHAAYADMVRYADRQVAEFVEALEKLGLLDNTIVFVASDNGTDGGLDGRRRGRKVQGGLYQITENGSNVACLVHSPRLVPAGRIGSMIDFSDIFPTMCELAGAAAPGGVAIDGRSYAGYILGKAAVPREWIFNEYRPYRVVRDGRFKLWNNGNLYDLASDPDESAPLKPSLNSEGDRARTRLQAVLDSMPADTPLPFPHLSLSAFRQRRAAVK